MNRYLYELTIDGETHTVKEWAAIKHFSYTTILHRIQRNWPVSRLFDPVKPNQSGRKPKLYTAFGEEASLREHADKHGVAYGTLIARMNRGLSIEEALTLRSYNSCRPYNSSYRSRQGRRKTTKTST